jgi:hypothetical protein
MRSDSMFLWSKYSSACSLSAFGSSARIFASTRFFALARHILDLGIVKFVIFL